MDDEEFLQQMKKDWEEQRRFFSNQGKEDRERWTVATFLEALSLPFEPTELRSPPQSDSVDIAFRAARFQIKEIVTPDDRRQDEIKDIANRVRRAKTVEDTIGPAFAYDTPEVTNGDQLILVEATKLSNHPRYLASKRAVDLLFYITRTRVSMPTQQTTRDALAGLDWRSISCLFGEKALILAAKDDAPDFLRNAP